MKLKFQTSKTDSFACTLQQRVQRITRLPGFMAQCRRRLWLKLFFYTLMFTGSYTLLVFAHYQNLLLLTLNYMVLGLSGILLAFNAAHDAVHGTFSENRRINHFIFTLCFNLQGVNGMLWRKRHIASHHVFPNVDGCDADIDDNPFMRLSASQPRAAHHRWQHWYATVLYMCYTLHWILFKDFLYLGKKQLANLKDLRYSYRQIISVVLWKCVYFLYMIVLPVMAGYSCTSVLVAFALMHMTISLFFVWTLIISHLCEETSFPTAGENGFLPYNFHEHQLAVSLDYHPGSMVANWIFGGFNAHSAHHLFHRLPHTAYPFISRTIRITAAQYSYPYHSLPLHKALLSHYGYLKMLGRAA